MSISELKTLLADLPGASEMTVRVGDGMRLFSIAGRHFGAKDDATDQEIAADIRFALSRARP